MFSVPPSLHSAPSAVEAARDIACSTWAHRDDADWHDSVWPQFDRAPLLASVRPAASDGCLCPACLMPAEQPSDDVKRTA